MRQNARALAAMLVLAMPAACNAVLGIHEVDVYGASLPDADGEPSDDSGSTEDASTVQPGKDAAVEDGRAPTDTSTPDAPPLPGPNAACVLGAKQRGAMTISASQQKQTGGALVTVSVTDTQMGFTNIELHYCTPTSATPIVDPNAQVISGSAPYSWSFPPQFLARGRTQLAISGDPTATSYETTEIVVE